jgi:gas vesicle protein
MHHDRYDHSYGFTSGILAGAVIGGALALLFAPKPGTQLRGDIGESVNSLRDALARRYRELADRAGVDVDDLQDQVERAAQSFEASARDFVDSAAERARRDTPAS